MAVETDADRLLFLNPDEFGVVITYAGFESINGILDADYFAVELGTQVPVEGARLRLICRSADLPQGGVHGDQAIITAVATTVDPALLGEYLVREVQPDGTGMTTLVLERQ